MSLVKIFLSVALPFAAEMAFSYDCITYADRAYKQGYVNKQLNCNYTGPRWSMSQQVHLNWCMGANLDVAQAEDRERRNALKTCVNQVPNIQNCSQYATLAGLQNTTNVTLGCGLRGPGWSARYDDHLNWCKSVFFNVDLRDSIASEDRRRRDALLICIER